VDMRLAASRSLGRKHGSDEDNWKTKPREGVGIEAGLHQPRSRMGGDGAPDKPSAARETTRVTMVRMLLSVRKVVPTLTSNEC
jgi:hypothetical protein